ncbi:hypothetical protein A2U01_0080588, partial [Trifolium medium]|nr:hypothetical protein [Trifolium medium]
IGVLKKVENGEIVIPKKYRQMEIKEKEEELEEGDNAEDGHEEGHSESDS